MCVVFPEMAKISSPLIKYLPRFLRRKAAATRPLPIESALQTDYWLPNSIILISINSKHTTSAYIRLGGVVGRRGMFRNKGSPFSFYSKLTKNTF